MLLRFTTIQAPNQEFIIAELCEFVAAKLGLETAFVNDIPWEERARVLDREQDRGRLDLQLAYVERMEAPEPDLELLAAPVMAASALSGPASLFLGVIIRTKANMIALRRCAGPAGPTMSPIHTRVTICTRWTLARLGAHRGFFREAVQAGSHQRSIEMVLQGEIDAAAMDGTVLEIQQQHAPDLMDKLPVIAALEPSPIPPLVISKRFPVELRAEIQPFPGRYAPGCRRPSGTWSWQPSPRYTTVSDTDCNAVRER